MIKSEAKIYLEKNKNAREVVEKRNLTAKHFNNGNGTFTMHAHIGHIHYKDKNDKKFKDCDTKLLPTVKGWEMKKASYELEIPKYADDYFKFINSFILDPRTNEEQDLPEETISMKPLGVGHIEGQLITDEKEHWKNKKIVYPNAYGQDIDLVIQARNLAFDKLVVINKKPTDLSKDLEFKFEIDVDGETIFKPKKDLSASVLENVREQLKTIESLRQTAEKEGKISEAKIEQKKYVAAIAKFEDETQREIWSKKKVLETSDSIILGKLKKTWFRDFKVWDSEGNQGICKVKLEEENGKLFLTKILDRRFLEKAVYPVVTDDSASYFSGAGDGYVKYDNNQTWGFSYAQTTGTTANHTTGFTGAYEPYTNGGNTSVIKRAFYPIDTSGLPDNADISAALLKLYSGFKTNGDNDGDDWINIVETKQASNTELVVADYEDCGNQIEDPTEGATRIDIGSLSTGQYNTWTLNATGRGWISKTSYTKLGAREGHDCLNNETGTSGNGLQVYYSEESGTSKDPYIEITYTAGAAERRMFLVE